MRNNVRSRPGGIELGIESLPLFARFQDCLSFPASISILSILIFIIYIHNSTAFSGQTILQLSHFVQRVWSISCFSYGLKAIAFTGHSWKHFVQPVHLSVIAYFIRSLHFFAGQIPFAWASYSSLKYLSPVSTGLGAVFPSPQRLPFLTSMTKLLKFINFFQASLSLH